MGAIVMAIAALLSLTSTASAEPTAAGAGAGAASMHRSEPPTAKPRVSTSPEPLPAAPNRTTAGPDHRPFGADDQPPLTRAAARERIDRMSPSRWLAHFGDVSIERRE